jgi:signal peptidase II
MKIYKNLKGKILKNDIIVSFTIIMVTFVLDRLSKISVIRKQMDNDVSFFVNNYLNFDLVWNTGIGFGFFSQNAGIYYQVTSFLIFLVIVYLSYLIVKSNYFDKMLFSLILGGALGNFYDRLFYLAVPDFIDIHINNFHWFTFNIADIFITVGVIFLIVKDLIIKKNENY